MNGKRIARNTAAAVAAAALAVAGSSALAQQQTGQQRGLNQQDRQLDQRQQDRQLDQRQLDQRQLDQRQMDRHLDQRQMDIHGDFRQDIGREQQVGRTSIEFRQQDEFRQQPGMEVRFGAQTQQLPVRGWVMVGYDFNNDGRFDAYEYLHSTDLEQCRMHAQDRGWREGIPTGLHRSPPTQIRQDMRFESQWDRTGTREMDFRRGQRQDFQRQDFQREFPQTREQWELEQRRFQQREQFDTFDPRMERETFRWQQQQQWQQRQPQQQQFERDRFERFGYEQEFRTQPGMTTQPGMMQSVSLTGEVESLTTVRLTGVREPHIVARVITHDGRTAHVDLGPRNRVRELNISEGERIRLVGTRGTINDQPVLLADRVEARGRTVSIQRAGLAGQLQRFENAQVIETWTTRMQHNSQDHTCAMVRLDDGRQMVVDLGPTRQLRNINLRRGDEISLVATEGTLDGRPALLAVSARVDDNTVNIDRPMQQLHLRSLEQRGGTFRGGDRTRETDRDFDRDY